MAKPWQESGMTMAGVAGSGKCWVRRGLVGQTHLNCGKVKNARRNLEDMASPGGARGREGEEPLTILDSRFRENDMIGPNRF